MKKSGKFILLFSTLLTLTALATSAAAQDNYFSWKLGSSQMEVDSISGLATHLTETVAKPTEKDDVTSFSIAYGHKATESALPLRMEIELSFRGAFDYSSNPAFTTEPAYGAINSDINSHTLFANLYLDLLPKSSIVPYVGGGGGIAWNVWDYGSWWDDDSDTTTSFAWNVGGGIALKMSRRLMIDVSYRYVDFGEASIPGVLTIEDITANEAQIGLRLNF